MKLLRNENDRGYTLYQTKSLNPSIQPKGLMWICVSLYLLLLVITSDSVQLSKINPLKYFTSYSYIRFSRGLKGEL